MIRAVRLRLAAMRKTDPAADWRMAVTATNYEQPDLYAHHLPDVFGSVEPLLRDAGVDMEPKSRPSSRP